MKSRERKRRHIEDGSQTDSAFCDGREFGETVYRGDG